MRLRLMLPANVTTWSPNRKKQSCSGIGIILVQELKTSFYIEIYCVQVCVNGNEPATRFVVVNKETLDEVYQECP